MVFTEQIDVAPEAIRRSPRAAFDPFVQPTLTLLKFMSVQKIQGMEGGYK